MASARTRGVRLTGLLLLALLSAQALLPAYAATYTMSLQTDQAAYTGTQAILITGAISPTPGANTAVVITVTNSAGSLADIDEAYPNATTGAFGYTSHPGGNAAWTSGTFTVNATWGGDGATASRVVTFAYTSTSSSTSSSSTSASSSSTSSSSSSRTSSSSVSTSSSSSTTTSAVPEFPTGALAVVALLAVALVAALSRRFAADPSRRAPLAHAAKTD